MERSPHTLPNRKPHRENPSSRYAEVKATRGKWVERGATAPLGTLVGTRITAAGKIDLLAGGNLDLLPAENTRQIEDRHQRWSLIDSSSLLPQLDHKVKDTTAETTRTPTGAHLDGQRVTLAANGNAHIVAARIHGQQGVDIAARGNLLVEAAQETRSSSHEHQESGFGLHAHFVSGRMRPLSLGTATARHADEAETARSVASRIESAQGLSATGI